VPDLSAQSLTCSPKPNCQFIVAGTSGLPRATYSSDLNNFAPRIGVAWRPGNSNRWVIRSAYGVFYDVGFLNANLLPRFNPPFYGVGLFFNGLLLGGAASTIQNILSQPPQPSVATTVDRGFRDSYSQQWNLDVQYGWLRNTVLDVSYVGSKGTGLTTQRNLNQSPPGASAFPFPQFGPIDLVQSTASSIYHALGLRAEKRFSQSLILLATYTWSKSIDNASALFGTAGEPGFPQDSLNLQAERGLSNFDTRHRFVASFVMQLPFGKDQPWLRQPGVLHAMLSDWEVSGIVALQSGQPFTVNRGVNQSGSGTAGLGIFADRPNLLADPLRPGPVASNPDPLCQRTVANGGRAADSVHNTHTWFNPCAFAGAGVAFGNEGRNVLLGPNLRNVDFAAARQIRMPKEGQALRLRAEFFNLFNRPSFDLPDRSFDSPTFGQVRSANANGNKPPRQIQISVRYLF